MRRYIFKRLLQLIPVLIGITVLSFAMMRLAGGDAVTYMYENAGSAVSQEIIDKTKAEYGLDKPFPVQYANWFAGMVTGDMGESYVSHRDVYETFIAKLPATIMLTVSSIILTVLLAVPLGILSAVKHNKWIDYVIRKIDVKNRAKLMQSHKDIFNNIIEDKPRKAMQAIEKHYELIEELLK